MFLKQQVFSHGQLYVAIGRCKHYRNLCILSGAVGERDEMRNIVFKELLAQSGHLDELENKWHFATLEKIFIREEMYIDFKLYGDRESLYKYMYDRFEPFKKSFVRETNDDDLQKLTQIPMIRITRFDASKADDALLKIEEEMLLVKANLANLVEYAIDYYKDLKKRFGAGKERKTEIKAFDNITASKVIIANRKLYVDYEEGFVGYGLKKTESISDCSEIDDIICFFSTGKR